jgi:hypothetical protein
MPKMSEASVKDMAQVGFQAQWGPKERADLAMMKSAGANVVRIDHALGSEYQTDHKAFLDEAHGLGLGVIAGFHSQNMCPNFDCHDSWKMAAEAGFKVGFVVNNSWHPAIRMLMLTDKPDYLNFIGHGDGSPPPCSDDPIERQKCGTRAVLSALDGFLAAEQGAGIGGNPKVAVAWSMNAANSIDGKIAGEGISCFHDMDSAMATPSMVNYTFKTDENVVKKAFDDRWLNALDTQSPWVYLTDKIVNTYEMVTPRPWFIANFDYKVPSGTDLASDLPAMDKMAADTKNPFMGVVFSAFQKDYKLNTGVLGMFGLGKDTAPDPAAPCWEDVLTGVKHCTSTPVHCLDPSEGDPGRLDAMRKTWGGSAHAQGICNDTSTKVLEVQV